MIFLRLRRVGVVDLCEAEDVDHADDPGDGDECGGHVENGVVFSDAEDAGEVDGMVNEVAGEEGHADADGDDDLIATGEVSATNLAGDEIAHPVHPSGDAGHAEDLAKQDAEGHGLPPPLLGTRYEKRDKGSDGPHQAGDGGEDEKDHAPIAIAFEYEAGGDLGEGADEGQSSEQTEAPFGRVDRFGVLRHGRASDGPKPVRTEEPGDGDEENLSPPRMRIAAVGADDGLDRFGEDNHVEGRVFVDRFFKVGSQSQAKESQAKESQAKESQAKESQA